MKRFRRRLGSTTSTTPRRVPGDRYPSAALAEPRAGTITTVRPDGGQEMVGRSDQLSPQLPGFAVDSHASLAMCRTSVRMTAGIRQLERTRVRRRARATRAFRRRGERTAKHPGRPSPWVAGPRGKVEGLCADGGRVVARSEFRDPACSAAPADLVGTSGRQTRSVGESVIRSPRPGEVRPTPDCRSLPASRSRACRASTIALR